MAGKAFMVDPEVWAKRPLPAALLAYAAFDVSCLLQLQYARHDESTPASSCDCPSAGPLTACVRRVRSPCARRVRTVMLPLLHFEYDVAVQKYLDSCRDEGMDTAHIVPEFESGLLRHLLRNIRASGYAAGKTPLKHTHGSWLGRP